ncbi:mitochondrial import protein-like protein mmp37 [Patellaria atrata CBS 101060]|uniref:Phosphatidate cytidylyltransferase, mitochondrial n=1 Tax=Patellaria atrata CBS 101060 TaxID=1346257 RepID=A0A9P4VSS7_9PEZI|nr:mitochondrial import protein-like protein mmp37 [Patellaria atrata CBS 101060]
MALSHPAKSAEQEENAVDHSRAEKFVSSARDDKNPSQVSSSSSETGESTISDVSLPEGWEDNPDWNITKFSELPHAKFGYNQHIIINEEFKEALRQMLWQFRAPIRYAFAYGSGVFPQSSSTVSSSATSPHPHPPEAITKWQKGGGKIIDFIFGVSFTQHWHSLNLTQHRDHYSFLGSFGSGLVSRVQDSWGAGVYFNPYITVNGTMIKYGVVNLDTIAHDLSQWDTLYLAGRLQKPVKILRDDARIRLANQVNLISAVRTALLMLPDCFTERELFEAIAGISYMGDPRMSFGSENPQKVKNIVSNQLTNFRQLYLPLIESLPNVTYNDSRCTRSDWTEDPSGEFRLSQDMDPVKRGNMVRRLPKSFRNKVYFQYQRKFQIPGGEFKKMLEETKDEDENGIKRQQGGEFERRIAGEDDIKTQVGHAIRATVKWPSTSQSIKGIFTSGPSKSIRYLKEKREKSNQGKKEAAATSEKTGGEDKKND